MNTVLLILTTFCVLLIFTEGFYGVGMRRIQTACFQIKSKYKNSPLIRGNLIKNRLSTIVEIPADEKVTDNAFAKRKVALTISYVGSKYFGLQIDLRPEFPTIEAELEEALFKLGCIRESNHKDLSKIKWSRSSRTDKHVHSARLVISTKLEVRQEWIIGEEQRMPELVEKLNLILPADIRVLSVCKINQGFRAREACSWREYEYLLPKSILLSNSSSSSLPQHEQNKDAILALFAKSLKRYEGSNSFHNFHRLSPKNLKGRLFTNGESEDNPTDAEDFSGLPREDNSLMGAKKEIPVSKTALAEDRIAQINATFQSPDNNGYMYNLYENWVPKLRDQTEMTRNTVFACEIIKGDNSSSSSRDFIRLRVRGQSFLLHQIRIMIGAAVLVSRGTLPESALELALVGPYFINFPLAPAEGLILVNAGFERNVNGQNIGIYPAPESNVHSLNSNDTLNLMTHEEFEFSEEFKEKEIYAKVKEDWYRENSELSLKWLEHSERFRPSEILVSKFNEMAENFKEIAASEYNDRRSREATRLERNVADFQSRYINDNIEVENEDKKNKDDRSGRKPLKIQRVPHKKLLPNTIATAIVTKFRVLPGDNVTEVLRALATLFANGKLPFDIKNEDLVQYIVDNGGFDHFLNNVEKHPMIE